MNNLLKVAVMLTAYDQMSRTVRDAVSKSKSQIADLNSFATKKFAQGAGLLGASQMGFSTIGKTVEAYADLEDASLSLQSVMMNNSGVVDKSMLNKLDRLAVDLGNKLPGTTADMSNLFATMIQNGEQAENIVNGVGASAANLAIALKMPYEEAGKFAVKMKQATGTANQDMMSLMDTIARTANLGVDATEMQYAFGRSAGSLKLMNIQGLESSKTLASVFALLIRNGKSGETVGSGMSAVFNSFMNPKKISALNDATKKFGIEMDFVDKKSGSFKGVENMMIQFNKLRGLNSAQRAGIVQAFLGPGQDADFMNTLIAEGLDGFHKINNQMNSQANLSSKVNLRLSGLKNTYEATTGSISNLWATLGSGVANELSGFLKGINNIVGAIQSWFQENPKFGKFIMLTATFVSTALAIAGVVKIIQGVIAVMKVLNIVMALNPFLLIVGAGILAAAFLIAYWDDVVDFFGWLWETIKSIFITAFKWFSFTMLALFAPPVLIYIYWNEISAYFIRLWNKVKNIFTWAKNNIGKILMHMSPYTLVYYYWDDISNYFIRIWNKVLNTFVKVHIQMFNAGKNIGLSIYNGLKSVVNKPIETMDRMTKKMREYLPFSPAKAGAFRDLHKVKIVETIAQAIKPAPLVRRMGEVTGSLAGVGVNGGGAGGQIVVHFSPVIHMGASSESDKKSFVDMLKNSERELVRLIEEAVRKSQRGRY